MAKDRDARARGRRTLDPRDAKLGRVVETHILQRWGAYFIDKITVPEIDAWVRTLTTSYSPETIAWQ
jgi:hypothetical protein